MAKKDTHIVLVVDRSGSMGSIKDKAQTGVNDLLNEQKNVDGVCTVSLYEFDDKIDMLYHRKNIKDCPQYTLVPRNMTSLLDAMGKAITDTKEKVETLSVRRKPGLIIVCVVTDGQENNSREYNRAGIAKLVSETKGRGWQYTFLCADPQVEKYAKDLGVDVSVTYDTNLVDKAYVATSSKFTRMRGMQNALQQVDNTYTATELNMMVQT